MSVFMQENAQKILNDLRAEERAHETLYKRYKNCHKVLKFLIFGSSMISLGCYSSSVATILTAPAFTTIFTAIGLTATGTNLFCTKLDLIKTKKLHKHKQQLLYTKQTINQIIKAGLTDNEITVEEYDKICDISEQYWENI